MFVDELRMCASSAAKIGNRERGWFRSRVRGCGSWEWEDRAPARFGAEPWSLNCLQWIYIHYKDHLRQLISTCSIYSTMSTDWPFSAGDVWFWAGKGVKCAAESIARSMRVTWQACISNKEIKNCWGVLIKSMHAVLNQTEANLAWTFYQYYSWLRPNMLHSSHSSGITAFTISITAVIPHILSYYRCNCRGCRSICYRITQTYTRSLSIEKNDNSWKEISAKIRIQSQEGTEHKAEKYGGEWPVHCLGSRRKLYVKSPTYQLLYKYFGGKSILILQRRSPLGRQTTWNYEVILLLIEWLFTNNTWYPQSHIQLNIEDGAG